MFRIGIIAAAGLFASAALNAASAATAKCTSVSARCAVEIGGVCDPKTGRWEYGRNRYTGSGGTNRGGAFDACISRELTQKDRPMTSVAQRYALIAQVVHDYNQ